MSEWQNLNIGSICKKIIDYRGKTPEKVSYGTKLITSKVIKNNRILDNANFEYIRDDKYEEVMRRGKPELFDILFTTEAPLGEVALIKNDEKIAIAQRIILLRANTDKVTPHFLFYSLIGPLGYGRIQQKGTGTTVLGIKNPELKKVILPIPPLPTQRKIAKILSNYDDLIENNLKRIKLLEESARLTYEEWFLRFRIDGKKLEIDPETKLPFGWERKNLFDIADVTYGYPFKASQFNSKKEGTPIIRIRNIPSSTTKDYTTEKVGDKYVVNSGDLLVGMDGEFHVNHWSGRQGYLVQRVCNIKTKNSDIFGYFCEAIKPSIKYYEATISGATVAHLGKKHLEEIEIVIPDKGFDHNLNKFNNLLSEKLNLTNQNHFLKEARDILLPRLMTGMIDTDDMDIAV